MADHTAHLAALTRAVLGLLRRAGADDTVAADLVERVGGIVSVPAGDLDPADAVRDLESFLVTPEPADPTVGRYSFAGAATECRHHHDPHLSGSCPHCGGWRWEPPAGSRVVEGLVSYATVKRVTEELSRYRLDGMRARAVLEWAFADPAFRAAVLRDVVVRAAGSGTVRFDFDHQACFGTADEILAGLLGTDSPPTPFGGTGGT